MQNAQENHITVTAMLRCEQGGTPEEYDKLAKELMDEFTFPLRCAFVVKSGAENENSMSLMSEFSIYVKADIKPEEKREMRADLATFSATNGLSITKVELTGPRTRSKA